MSPTILVVEDDVDSRLLLADLLRDEGYAVLEAADGVEALRILRSATVDGVVLDLMMPGADGWDVLVERQADEALRRVPVVVVSTSRSASEDARLLGANAYITKPFDLEHLVRTLASALATSDGEI